MSTPGAAGAILVPHDLMAVYDNLVPMIDAQCGDLASTSNPVMFTFIDTCAPQDNLNEGRVPADIARALWAQALQALRDIGDAALDPSRQLDAVSQLGLQPGFCPNLAVLVYQYWPVDEVIDGRLQKRHSYEPRVGVPRRLQVELRAHGRAPVIAEWKVLERDGSACATPRYPRHFVGPSHPAPPKLPTAADVAAVARAAAECGRRSLEASEAKLASMQLPTFVVRPPPLQGRDAFMIHLGDSRYVTPQDEDARNLNGGPEFRGFVTLQVQNRLIVPTFYGTHEAEQYSFLPRGTTMVACWPGGVPYFKIVVIQPLTVVSSGP